MNFLKATLLEIDRRLKSSGEIPGMKSGLVSFDKNIGGLNKGELNVIAGRPSMGKNSLCIKSY